MWNSLLAALQDTALIAATTAGYLKAYNCLAWISTSYNFSFYKYAHYYYLTSAINPTGLNPNKYSSLNHRKHQPESGLRNAGMVCPSSA